MNLVELERAVQLSFELASVNKEDPEKFKLKNEISAYLSSFSQRKDSWRGYIDLLITTQVDVVKFYALQQLRNSLLQVDISEAGNSIQFRESWRNTFLSWLRSKLPSFSEEKPFVKNYVALVYTLLLKLDYPERWPSAFQSLLEVASHGGPDRGGLELFLKVLRYIDQEIVSFRADRCSSEIEHNTIIKDEMRKGPLLEIVEIWYSVFVLGKDLRADLVRECLDVMSEYIGWIDINLSVNDRIIPIFHYFLVMKPYRISAATCLYEVFAKGMPELEKLQLFQRLKILEVLSQLCEFEYSEPSKQQERRNSLARAISQVQTSYGSNWSFVQIEDDYEEDDQDEGFHQALAEMNSLICQELMNCARSLKENEAVLAIILSELKRSISLLISNFLTHKDIHVQGATLDFISRLVAEAKSGSLKETNQRNIFSSENMANSSKARDSLGLLFYSFLPSLIQALTRSMCYPQKHSFKAEDETEILFESHRKELRKLFVNISRLAAVDIALPFLQSLVHTVFETGSLQNRTMSEVEVVLTLLYAFPEGETRALDLVRKGKKEKSKPFTYIESPSANPIKPVIAKLVAIVHQAGLSRYPHPHVVFCYNDLTARYITLIVQYYPNLLPVILQELASTGGIKHPDAKVRSHSCYLLLRVLKAIGSTAGSFAKDLLLVLKELLIIPPEAVLYELSSNDPTYVNQPTSEPLYLVEDLMNLFEISGILIGSKWANNDLTPSYLQAVIQDSLKQLEEVSKNGSSLLNAECAGHCVGAIAAVSKGFAGEFEPEIKKIYKSVLDVALKTLASFPVENQGCLYTKVIVYLHRLVSGFGRSFLSIAPRVMVHLFDNTASSQNLVEFIIFLCQLVREHQEALFECIDALLLPLLRKVDTHLSNLNRPHLHTVTFNQEENEFISIQRHSFTFLYDIITSRLSSVLISPRNVDHFEGILKYLSNGLISTPHPVSQRICISALNSLLQNWIPSNYFRSEDFRIIIHRMGLVCNERFVSTPTNEVWESLAKIVGGSLEDGPAPTKEAVYQLSTFMFHNATPASFEAVLSQHITLNDASCLNLLNQVCLFHLTLTSRFGVDWLYFVLHFVSPRLNLPNDSTKAYITDVLKLEMNPKALRTKFIESFKNNMTRERN